MGFPILVRLHLYIESGPWPHQDTGSNDYLKWCCSCPPWNWISTTSDPSVSWHLSITIQCVQGNCAFKKYSWKKIFHSTEWLLDFRGCCWPAHGAGLLWSNFFGQPGSVSKFPPFLCVKLWVGWVGRGYIEISRYFPALWIIRVTLVTKIKLWCSLGY